MFYIETKLYSKIVLKKNLRQKLFIKKFNDSEIVCNLSQKRRYEENFVASYSNILQTQ